MTPQELKNSILQLAIQGKLVDQRPEEGTAEDLYRQIQAEKQALIKAGKIKREKPLPEITEDEKPFDIPESWKWVRLGTIGYTNIGLTYNPKDVSADGTIVLRSSNIKDGRMDYSDIVRVKEDIPDNKMCQKGDILICVRNGSKRLVGKAAIVDSNGMSFGAFMAIFRSECNPYIYHVINSVYFRNSLLGDTGTTTINQITQDMLKNALVPLPSLAEQKRIVAKIEELLPLIDRYEQAWTRLEAFNKRFPSDMQKSLLQLAIQGKLVDQRPEEGTGEDLYRQIQAEKQSLIRSGKLKKEKPFPEITEDEKPFDIPESWSWVRIEQIVYRLFAGGDKPLDFVEKADDKRKIPVIANGVSNDGILGYTAIPTAKANTITVAGRGTIGFSVYRNYEYCPVVRLIVIEQCEGIYPPYLQCVLQALPEKSLGTSIPQLTVPMLKPKLIPLPPFAEQKRIVAKLEELLPLCERLK